MYVRVCMYICMYVCISLSLSLSIHILPDMPCMKKVSETKKRRYSGQQPGTKSGRRPGDKPVIGRGSIGCFDPPSVYIGFPLFVLPKDRSRHCLRCPGGQQGQLSPGRTDLSATRPALPRPASPLRRAPTPPRPARGMSGFWLKQVYILCF